MSESNNNPTINKPFTKLLPTAGADYFEILGQNESLCIRSGLVTLSPGKEVGWHSTEKYEELLVVLAGRGKLLVKGFPDFEIEGGHIGYNPPHTEHNVINDGSEPLRYIYIVAPTA